MKTMEKTIIVLRGGPGSGKSTWIKGTLPVTAVVCSADDFFVRHGKGTYAFDARLLGRAHKECLNKFEKAISDGVDLIVVDNTNIRKSWYKDYVRFGTEHGYKVFQKCLTTRFVNTHGVPEDKVDKMISDFEVDTDLPEYTG